jgi:hypothetical protein
MAPNSAHPIGASTSRLFIALLTLAAGAAWAAGCAEGSVEFEGDDQGGKAAQGGDSSSGGAGPNGGDGGSEDLPCGVDCSTIGTIDCFKSVCNEGQYPGPVFTCTVVPDDDGTACDDGAFCTVNDGCVAGSCVGGPENDCDVVPDTCQVTTCDEASRSCSTAPSPNGAACTPTDLCQVNTTCNNGLCIGSPTDCFFAPVPNECHVSVCNPMNGQCEPIAGNEGLGCNDAMDLCTVNKSCASGVCQGGGPKDCSVLTQGCNIGTCAPASGQCVAQPVPNGGLCDDLDSCTSGEICTAGQCTGGMAITSCVAGDNCCPIGCSEALDSDCSCSTNIAPLASASSSGGGSDGTGYGPSNWNDGVNGVSCGASSCFQCQGWITNTSAAGAKWMQYTWPSVQQIGSMFIDTNDCIGPHCYTGRNIASLEVQWWDGAQWITATTVSGQTGDFGVTFNPKINTTQLRLFNVAAGTCGTPNNSLMYEWYVWPGSGCTP